MPKDDYFCIIYKILEYLYACMKSGKKPEISDISWNSEAIGINREYWEDIIRNIYDDGYIKGIVMIPVVGKEKPGMKFTGLCITTKGIEFLQDNSKMAKAAKTVRTVFETIGIFV